MASRDFDYSALLCLLLVVAISPMRDSLCYARYWYATPISEQWQPNIFLSSLYHPGRIRRLWFWSSSAPSLQTWSYIVVMYHTTHKALILGLLWSVLFYWKFCGNWKSLAVYAEWIMLNVRLFLWGTSTACPIISTVACPPCISRLSAIIT